LIAVAEEQNISRPAKRLFLAQPSLSAQLKSLEEALSLDLLVRVPTGVKLSRAAEVLVAGARQILSLRDEEIAKACASQHGTISRLRIGFSPFIDRALLQMECSLHSSLFPNCEITPKSGDTVELLSMLERGVIDVALLTLPANGAGLNIDRLTHDRIVVCMQSNDPAASQDEIDPSSLEKTLRIFSEPKQNPAGHRHF
jgi:DNA-binding transcriptional LysR family regulator